MVTASDAQAGDWQREYQQFSDAMNQCQQMIERTGGEKAWQRTGPDMTGTRFG